jgi:hypothetical protein
MMLARYLKQTLHYTLLFTLPFHFSIPLSTDRLTQFQGYAALCLHGGV